MKTVEIKVRNAGHSSEYCVLLVFTNGVRTEIHTGKRGYIERLAKAIIRVDQLCVR
jgi:hypothetical protein